MSERCLSFKTSCHVSLNGTNADVFFYLLEVRSDSVTINYTAPSQVIVDYNNLLSPILKIESEVRNL